MGIRLLELMRRGPVPFELVTDFLHHPKNEHNGDADLEGQELYFVEQPDRIQLLTRSTHTISYLAVRKIVPTLLQGASLQTVAPASEPKISKSRGRFFERVNFLELSFLCSF